MKVECKIRRPVSPGFPQGGSDVELGRVIKFRPIDHTRTDSPHVADVTADEASALFRADARVYVPYEAPEVEPVPPPSFAVSPPAPPAATPADTALAASAATAAGFSAAVASAGTEQGASEPQTAAVPPADTTPATTAATTPAATTGQAIEGDKNGNGELSVRELRELIGKGATPEYLRELLAIEEAKGEGKRSSFCDIIMRALT